MTNSNTITAALTAVDNLQEISVGLSVKPVAETTVISNEEVLCIAELKHLQIESQKLRAMLIRKTEEIIELKLKLEKEKEKQDFRKRFAHY